MPRRKDRRPSRGFTPVFMTEEESRRRAVAEHEAKVRALRAKARAFSLCMTCRVIFEPKPPAPGLLRQRCNCDRSEGPRWEKSDLDERAHLCECCRLELLPSGSRWSVWFCHECKEQVLELNARLGSCVVPIGRHSFMSGIGVPGSVLVHATDTELAAISESLSRAVNGWVGGIHRLEASAFERTGYLAHAAGLEEEASVPLDVWFERIEHLASRYPAYGKPAALRALVRSFGPEGPRTATVTEGAE